MTFFQTMFHEIAQIEHAERIRTAERYRRAEEARAKQPSRTAAPEERRFFISRWFAHRPSQP